MGKELELYLHIPFCVKKCAYCDFLSKPADEETRGRYVDAMVKEIEGCREECKDYTVTTVFMGGGTPSILAGREILRIFEALRRSFSFVPNPEMTIEANPGTVTEEKLDAWREAGINRLSIGLQSTSDTELRLLGRIHTYGDFLDTYHLARRRGFDNINVDLISAIPGQSVASWERTLKRTADLEPEHISAYSLIIEEGTCFYEWYQDGDSKEKGKCALRLPPLPDEETDRRIYRKTKEILEERGYFRYEISNYAKKGYACRHNLGYWERKEYLGIGLGASSLMQEQRFHNTCDLSSYLELLNKERKSPGENQCALLREELESLSVQEQMEEFFFLGLRKTQGVSGNEFLRLFGRSMDEVYGEKIRKLSADGLLIRQEDRLRLTEYGVDVSNYVFGELLL